MKCSIFECQIVSNDIVYSWNAFGGGGTGVGPSTQSTVVQSVQISWPFIFVPGGSVAAKIGASAPCWVVNIP